MQNRSQFAIDIFSIIQFVRLVKYILLVRMLHTGGYREFQSHNINDVKHGASDARQVIILLLLLLNTKY